MTRIDAIRAAWGCYQIMAARLVAQTELGHPADRAAIVVMRVLGTRQVVQGLILRRLRSRIAHRIGGAIDIAHAASMVALASSSRERRRGAIIDAGVATFFAQAELRR